MVSVGGFFCRSEWKLNKKIVRFVWGEKFPVFFYALTYVAEEESKNETEERKECVELVCERGGGGFKVGYLEFSVITCFYFRFYIKTPTTYVIIISPLGSLHLFDGGDVHVIKQISFPFCQ